MKTKLQDTDKPSGENTAILVSIQHQNSSPGEAEELLKELENLTGTIGLESLEGILVKLRSPTSRYLVGSGKAEEIARLADELDAECIVFDDDLSPSQQRNWEKLTERCVIDRHEVILEIFARRASTKVAALQVGLARMEYSLPRLTRAWTHLSRQKGGTRGTRGEGETQLEVDRRIVLRKIHRMEQELKKVRAQRAIMRKQRQETPVPAGSIVGYTNAGKSSLLNNLTGAEVFVEDNLFATLDPTTRRISLPGGKELVLTDTIGFIRKLPHDLVDAFRSTLEETVLADFLIHILDASSPVAEHHYTTTLKVLDEIGAGGKPMITVFNKMDIVSDTLHLNNLHQHHPDAVFLSVKTGEGIEELINAVDELLSRQNPSVEYNLPTDRYDLIALIHRTGEIIEEHYEDNRVRVIAKVPEKTEYKLKKYKV
ncbi:MAG: GTPase HflX [Spirochaetales bacterium]|nr:GTPase HflX [Spirochaetales bacterium]